MICSTGVIVSSLPGRVRIRHSALRSEGRLELGRARLLGLSGVTTVRADARVGSLLVGFDPGAIDERALLGALELGPVARPNRAADPLEPSVPVCMATSLAVTLGAAALKLKWVHVAAGLVFVACVGAHVLGPRLGKRRQRDSDDDV